MNISEYTYERETIIVNVRNPLLFAHFLEYIREFTQERNLTIVVILNRV